MADRVQQLCEEPVGATPDPEVMVLLSGGVDSAACIDFYRDLGRRPCAVFVDYQQPAAVQERTAAFAIAHHYQIAIFSLTWRGSVQKTEGLIPSRNAFLLAAALMERPRSVTGVAIGIHAGTSYTDCSAPFITAMQTVFDCYAEGRVRIMAPFLAWSKSDVWAYCRYRGVPIEIAYSCERGGPTPCGRCLSCVDRERMNACT